MRDAVCLRVPVCVVLFVACMDVCLGVPVCVVLLVDCMDVCHYHQVTEKRNVLDAAPRDVEKIASFLSAERHRFCVASAVLLC